MFKPEVDRRRGQGVESFNLLSEILFVQATSTLRIATASVSFNLLSEILFVQARGAGRGHHNYDKFQSLERDSVCSSPSHTAQPQGPGKFQSLERDSVCSSVEVLQTGKFNGGVSIS